MKSLRYVLSLIVVVIPVFAMADKKMTIRNADTGESFEVTVPDGLRICEYNSNWLDSIPYLMEHARNGEPWAHEALGDCYRFGKGGMDRSFFNAIFSYDLAGKDISELIDTAKKGNSDDLMSVFSRLIDYVENRDCEKIACAIDTLNKSGYHSADILREYVSRRTGNITRHEVIEFLAAPETDADACLFAAAGCALCEMTDSVEIDISWVKPLLLDKIPYLYSEIGVRKYEETIKAETSDGYVADVSEQDYSERRKAVEYLLKADEYATLSKKVAEWLYHYCTQDSSSDWVSFTDEDLYRIGIIAGNI